MQGALCAVNLIHPEIDQVNWVFLLISLFNPMLLQCYSKWFDHTDKPNVLICFGSVPFSASLHEKITILPSASCSGDEVCFRSPKKLLQVPEANGKCLLCPRPSDGWQVQNIFPNAQVLVKSRCKSNLLCILYVSVVLFLHVCVCM